MCTSKSHSTKKSSSSKWITWCNCVESCKSDTAAWSHCQPTDDPNLEIEDLFIARLHGVLQENLSDDTFDIAALCATLKISRSQLHNKLKSLTGLSTSHYLRQFRLVEAKKLMAINRQLNISEIAFKVGFKDPKYFSKVFKQKFGMSPSEWPGKIEHKIGRRSPSRLRLIV